MTTAGRTRVAALVAEREQAAARADEQSALRRSERRREAAEQAAARTRAELVALQARIDELTAQLAAFGRPRTQGDAVTPRTSAPSSPPPVATRATPTTAPRRPAAGSPASRRDRDAAIHRAEAAETQRDALLVDRAERGGVEVSGAQVVELRELARAARGLADRSPA